MDEPGQWRAATAKSRRQWQAACLIAVNSLTSPSFAQSWGCAIGEHTDRYAAKPDENVRHAVRIFPYAQAKICVRSQGAQNLDIKVDGNVIKPGSAIVCQRFVTRGPRDIIVEVKNRSGATVDYEISCTPKLPGDDPSFERNE